MCTDRIKRMSRYVVYQLLLSLIMYTITTLVLHSNLQNLWFAQTQARETSLISLSQVQKWYCMNYHIRYLFVVKVFVQLRQNTDGSYVFGFLFY